MTKEHKDKLTRARADVVDHMVPTAVLNKLQAAGIVNSREVARIKKMGEDGSQNEAIGIYCRKKTDRAFNAFLKALKDSSQEHIVRLIQP